MNRLFSIVVLFVAGCGPSTGRGTTPGGGATLTSIEVQPADATIAIDNGSGNTPIGYSAIGHFSDGKTQPLGDATFALDDIGQRLGALAGTQFSASGNAAGTGHVTATSQGKSGSTGVTVTVHQITLGPGVPPDAPGKLPPTATPGALSPQVVYPLDGALMPASVASPDVQWEGTAQPGDLFRVKLVAGGATVESIVANASGFTWDFAPSAAAWALLTASAGASPITVTVDHWDAQSGLEGSNPIKVSLAAADVRGAIYYWDLSEGKMQRLDDSGRNLAIPNPPAAPSDANNHCVACHTISRDGRFLAGELWGGGLSGAVFDLANPTVIMGNPAPTMAPVNTYNSLFSTFNADATRLLINDGTSLKLIDPKTGMALPTTGTPLPAAKAAHPTWSPDGTLVAFVNNIDGGWAVDYTTGDLAVIAAGPGDSFGAPATIVSSSTGDPAFKAPSWPSFSPDSQLIAYAAGTNSRGRNAVGMPPVETVYPGALFLVGRAGGTPTRLDNACSGQRNCYLPCFSPYDSGGYFWLVFYSVRDYGNAQAGTKGTQRRQMWVTAIDKSKLAAGGGDPSSVPYWLPMQDPKTENMSAFWAPPPPLQ
jgi:hypothetical protein